MKRFWTILAGVSAFVAVVFFLRLDYDKAFISAALGVVCWFLGYRVQIKEMVQANQSEEELHKSSESNEEEDL